MTNPSLQLDTVFRVVSPSLVLKFLPTNVKLDKSIKLLIKGFNRISNDLLKDLLQQQVFLLFSSSLVLERACLERSCTPIGSVI